MSEATAPRRAVSRTDPLAAIVGVAIEEIQLTRRVVQQALDGGGFDRLALSAAEARLSDLAGDFRAGVTFRTAQDALDATTPALEAVPDPERGPRHRRPRKYRLPRQRVPGDGQPDLWSVEGIAAVPVAVKVTALVAAAVLAAGGGITIARAVLAHPSAAASAPASSSPAGTAPGWGTRVAPGPSSSLIAFTRPKPDAARAQAAGPASLAPALYSPPSPSSSAPPASPSPSQSSAAAQGQLQVSTEELDLGLATSETVTLTARLGPVTWSASTTSADVSLDSYGGTLQAGQSVTVTVSVNPLDSLTRATVDFSTGSYALAVKVTWILPLPLPSVSPSPLPSLILPS